MTDRELLELAAKAAGYLIAHMTQKYGNRDEPIVVRGFGLLTPDGQDWQDYPHFWNPLTDDGDSRRLQVALSIDLRFGVSDNFGPYVHARTEVRRGDFIDFHECYQWVSLHPGGDAAVRRAVLEVAAAIGQSMS